MLSELSHRDGPGYRGDRLQAAGQFMDRLSQAALPFLEEQEEAADRLKEYLAYADALLYAHLVLPCQRGDVAMQMGPDCLSGLKVRSASWHTPLLCCVCWIAKKVPFQFLHKWPRQLGKRPLHSVGFFAILANETTQTSGYSE